MKQLLLLSLVILSVGCTYNQRPVQQTLEPTNEGRVITIYNTNLGLTWHVVQGSDGHEYMENNGNNAYVLIHYPDCVKCLKRDTTKTK
jgi:hypothetical protein